jgi:hypothetical protein
VYEVTRSGPTGTIPSIAECRSGIGPMCFVDAPCAVPVHVSRFRIAPGQIVTPYLFFAMPWRLPHAPATIGVALEVPLKIPV